MASEPDAALMAKMREVHWVPLESNPDTLNSFAWAVGMPKTYSFVDILGTDEELLCMVPPGCVAVTLLFDSSSENIRAFKAEQRTKIEADGQKVAGDVKYMRQYVGNACGTIATIHSVANNAELVGLPADSHLGKFLAAGEGKSADAIGAMLAEATELHMASEESAQEGQTEAPEATAEIHMHFIAFVEKGGEVYELDGGKGFPVNHGPAEGGLLKASLKVVQANFMAKNPDSLMFNMMALVPTPED